MRVIAGQLARRRFDAPRGRDTRPTGDRVREALFQHLEAARLPAGFRDLAVLDLYAGSGALAFEALSRGASRAVLVEQARAALDCIRANVDALGLRDRVEIVAASLPRALERVRGPVDVVFLDPPYAESPLSELVATIERRGLASPRCVIVYEHGASSPAPDLAGWTPPATRIWGDTAVTFYERPTDPTAP